MGCQTLFSLLSMVLVLSFSVHADDKVVEYQGAYSGDLIWENTVTMSGDVLILQGGSLTIRAGTQVNVIPAEGTKIDPEYLSSQIELLIRGRLDILGTADAPVRFVIAETPSVETVAWSGITLDEASSSHINYALLERADIAIRCVQSSPLISNSKFSHCRYGIVAQQQSNPVIYQNLITAGEGGVFCWLNSSPYLHQNTITGHDEEGVFVDASSHPRLEGNRISGNSIGLALYPPGLSFDPALVTDNLENVRWLGLQGQSGGR